MAVTLLDFKQCRQALDTLEWLPEFYIGHTLIELTPIKAANRRQATADSLLAQLAGDLAHKAPVAHVIQLIGITTQRQGGAQIVLNRRLLGAHTIDIGQRISCPTSREGLVTVGESNLFYFRHDTLKSSSQW